MVGPFSYDDEELIPVQGPDVAPIPQADGGQSNLYALSPGVYQRLPVGDGSRYFPESEAPPLADGSAPAMPANHTMSIIEGGKIRDVHYANGQINQEDYKREIAGQQQALSQAQAGYTGAAISPASGPHTDKFDYQYSPQQLQRLTYLQSQKSKVMYDRGLSPAQRLHATTEMDREIGFIMRSPIATPKQKAPLFPNGHAAGEIFTDPLSGRVMVNDDKGIPKAAHEDPLSSIVKIATELQKSDKEANADNEYYKPKPFSEYLKQAQGHAKDARKIDSQMGPPTPPEAQPNGAAPSSRREVAIEQLRNLQESIRKSGKKMTPEQAATILKYRDTIEGREAPIP